MNEQEALDRLNTEGASVAAHARQMGHRPGRIAVDGLGEILRDLLGGPVEFATLTAGGNSVQMGKGWENPESDPLGDIQKAAEISPEAM